MYELIPTKFFLEQLNDLSFKSKRIIKDKLILLKENPFRNKRIKGYKLFLFRIRNENKRVIYLVNKKQVKVLCILDRKNDYKDLRRYLKRFGY